MIINRIATALVGCLTSAAALALTGAGPTTAPTTKPAAEYPLKTCVVSGEDLDSMGKPVIITYEGREVRLCCRSCVGDFKADPAKYLKKLDEAAAKAPSTRPAGEGK